MLNRTTRSVALTDAGLRLLGRAPPVVEQISRALDDLKSDSKEAWAEVKKAKPRDVSNCTVWSVEIAV